MMASYFSALIVTLSVLFASDALSYSRLNFTAFAGDTQATDENWPENFPESEGGKIMADDEYTVLLFEFSFSGAEANVFKCRSALSTRFSSNSYCEISTPPPRNIA